MADDKTRRYVLQIEIEVRPQDDLEHFQPNSVAAKAPQLNVEWVSLNDREALEDFFAFFFNHRALADMSGGAGIDAVVERTLRHAEERQALESQITAMRPIVAVVAEAAVGDEYGGGSWLMFAGYDAETIREHARAFMATHPAQEGGE